MWNTWQMVTLIASWHYWFRMLGNMKDERHDRFIQYLSSIEAVSFLKSSSLECLYRYLRYPRNSNFNLFNTNPIQDAQLVLDYSTSYIILWRSSPCLWSDADPEPWVEMTHQWTTRWPKPSEAFTEQLVTTTKIPKVRPISFKLGAFKAFLSSKPLVVVLVFFQKLRLVLFRNWDWQALVVSVFPVPAGPAGLSWWIVDCFFHMPVFAPHLHIKWLDTELEVWSHQPHQSQPCHELPDAPPKNIPRAWDLDVVFGWFSWCFLMKLMKLWHPQPETGWDSTDLSELWWPT